MSGSARLRRRRGAIDDNADCLGRDSRPKLVKRNKVPNELPAHRFNSPSARAGSSARTLTRLAALGTLSRNAVGWVRVG